MKNKEVVSDNHEMTKGQILWQINDDTNADVDSIKRRGDGIGKVTVYKNTKVSIDTITCKMNIIIHERTKKRRRDPTRNPLTSFIATRRNIVQTIYFYRRIPLLRRSSSRITINRQITSMSNCVVTNRYLTSQPFWFTTRSRNVRSMCFLKHSFMCVPSLHTQFSTILLHFLPCFLLSKKTFKTRCMYGTSILKFSLVLYSRMDHHVDLIRCVGIHVTRHVQDSVHSTNVSINMSNPTINCTLFHSCPSFSSPCSFIIDFLVSQRCVHEGFCPRILPKLFNWMNCTEALSLTLLLRLLLSQNSSNQQQSMNLPIRPDWLARACHCSPPWWGNRRIDRLRCRRATVHRLLIFTGQCSPVKMHSKQDMTRPAWPASRISIIFNTNDHADQFFNTNDHADVDAKSYHTNNYTIS